MRKVLVLDSGLGGLNVVDSLSSLRKDVDYIYFADEAYCPYGERSVEQICSRVKKICSVFGGVASEVVLACNTASVCMFGNSTCATDNGILLYRNQRLIATVKPTVDKVGELSRGVVCLLATKLCLQTDVYQSMFLQKGVICLAVDCTNFVSLVENPMLSNERLFVVKNTLANFGHSLQNVDTVVLGCTHFDNLSGEIKSCFCKEVNCISSALETAKFAAKHLSGNYGGHGSVDYLSSGNFQYVSRISRQSRRNFRLFDI